MPFPHNISGPTLGMFMVFITLPISWVAGIIAGGCKIGSLEKKIHLILSKAELSTFMERLQRRLLEIGFVAGNKPGHFMQSGAVHGDLTSFTHAKTKKLLTVVVSDHNPEDVEIELRAKYLDPIVGDTGESAYRDAILNYVSGTTDSMQMISNRSYAAFSCLMAGIFAWPALLYLKHAQYEPLSLPFLVYGLTNITLGILAIYSIGKRPGELTGTPLAIVGMAATTAAFVFAVL